MKRNFFTLSVQQKRVMKVPIWFNPIYIITAWFLVALIAFLLPESIYFNLMRTPKYIDGKTIMIIWFCLSSFIVGSVIGMMVNNNKQIHSNSFTKFYLSLNLIYTKIVIASLCILCVIAYIIWLGPTFSIEILIEVINSSGGAIGRQYGNLITGVTTLTQIGIPFSRCLQFFLVHT